MNLQMLRSGLGNETDFLANQWLSDKEFETEKEIKKIQQTEHLNEIIRYNWGEDCNPRGCARHSLFQDDMGEE